MLIWILTQLFSGYTIYQNSLVLYSPNHQLSQFCYNTEFMIYMYINLRTLFLPQNYCLISLSLVEQLIYLSALQQSPKIDAQWNMIETQYIYKHTWWTTGGSCLTGQQTAESSVVVPGYMWRESGWRGPGEKTRGQDLMTEWGQGAWRHSTKKYHKQSK